ncbi:Uncharacterised protein [Mycobacteroides abscessus subsp. abscessus]|nr:Uncharacterised protein [Mycobacteroides abscessus subsp. abscessus]
MGPVSPAPTRFGVVRSGRAPARRNRHSQPGRVSTRGANRMAVRTSMRSGSGGLPQSRAVANTQSRVTMRPLAPARLARSSLASIASLSPSQ